MSFAPSGEQFAIVRGAQRATVVSVGGGLREYAVAGRAVLDPYDVGAIRDGAHGAPLVPWPNRLADGRYAFDGEDFQVALTEPEKHNAIHGFLLWQTWRVVEHEDERLTLTARIHPQEGYPFALDVRVTYALGDAGLVVTTTATNVGVRPCPYAHGQHPYLSPGSGLLDGCDVQLPGRTRITTDAERQLPTGREDVVGTPFDFRERRLLGDLEIDFAFTDLERDPAGRAWTRLWGPDGACAELWVDEAYGYVEAYTGDTLTPERARRGLGVEPMTCPPNALATGEDVIRLEPGASVTTCWGAQLA
jgi:aldose 1-epimerase